MKSQSAGFREGESMTQDEIRQMIAGNAFVNASDVEIIEEEDGEIITRVTLADKHKNPYGTAHGGLLGSVK